MGRPDPEHHKPRANPDKKPKPPMPHPANDDDGGYGDAGDIATPEPDRDDEQRGL